MKEKRGGEGEQGGGKRGGQEPFPEGGGSAEREMRDIGENVSERVRKRVNKV